MLADLEAGLNDLIWAQPRPGDVVLAVAETSAKSFEIARRAVQLAQEMGVTRIIGVANRAGADLDPATVAAQLGVSEVVLVPEDPSVEKADHLGLAAMDVDPTSPAMQAIVALAHRLTRPPD